MLNTFKKRYKMLDIWLMITVSQTGNPLLQFYGYSFMWTILCCTGLEWEIAEWVYQEGLIRWPIKEGSVLFSVMWHQTYGKGNLTNPLPPHGIFFPSSSKSSLYTPSHRQDTTYHGIWYISHGALDGTTNSSVGQP